MTVLMVSTVESGDNIGRYGVKHRFLGFSIAAMAGVGLASAAQAQSQLQPQGVFVEGAVLMRHYELAQPGLIAQSHDSGTAASGKLVLGYDLGTWSVEGGYVSLGCPSYRLTKNGVNGKLGTDGKVWYAAATVMSLQLADKWNLTAKVGVSRHHLDVKGEGSAASLSTRKDKTDAYLAVGTEYAVTPQLAATAALEHFGTQAKPGDHLTGITMGLKYRF